MGKGVTILAILMVIINTITDGQEEPSPVAVQNAMQDFTQSLGSHINGGSFMPVFSHKGDTKGNRYLFDAWVHGAVISANNFVLDSMDYLFNYDKMTHHLFLTKDKKKVIEVQNEEFKAFTLIQENQQFVFVHVPLINQTDFFEELVKQPEKYSLYKLIRLNFDLMTGFSVVPLQLFSMLGMVVSGIGGLVATVQVQRRDQRFHRV